MKNLIIIAIWLGSTILSATPPAEKQDTKQNAPKIEQYLKMVATGRRSEVKLKIADLLAQYPNDVGVKLLQAVVIEDAYKAMEIYLDIVQNHPDSPWADDAYWRIVQFHALTGDIPKAQYELDNFRRRFPTSPFLGPATDVVFSAIILEKTKLDRAKTPEEKPDGQSKVSLKEVSATTAKPDAKKETPEPKSEAARTAPKTETVKASSVERWGLQAGVFNSHGAAEAEMQRFQSLRFRADIEEKNVEGARGWAVIIGNYSSREAAESAKILVEQQCKCETVIYKK
ncbi:MAG: SPOR domain-containing protein [Chloroflexota bacterium]